VHANIVLCSRHQPTTVLNWPEQAPSTNTPHGPPLSSNHLPIRLFQHIHLIQQNQNWGTPRTNVHPSRVKTSHSGRYLQETGQDKENLQNSSSPPPTRDSTLPSRQPTITSHNKVIYVIMMVVKCKQAGRQYISASAKLGN
jgi:hypothetical protein